MVKGEHLRPLLGFAAVCVTAALIIGTGLSTPSLRGIAAAPQVNAVREAPDLVLGKTFDNVSPSNHGSSAAGRSSDSPAAHAADQRTTAVLVSLSLPAGAEAAPSRAASSTPVHSAKSRNPRKPHRNSHQVQHATPAPKPQATTTAPAPTPTPAPPPQPQPAPEPGRGSGHGMGHGVGHGSRNGSTHATPRGPGTAIVGHLDKQVEHGPGPGRHGDHVGPGDHGRPGPPGHAHEHRSSYGSDSPGRHR
jgi:hypothetical protein